MLTFADITGEDSRRRRPEIRTYENMKMGYENMI